jgi:hypothetical protein
MWSLTEECTLQMSEVGVVRKIIGHTRTEISGQFRMFHDDKLCDLDNSSSIVRVVKSRWL